MDFVSNFPLGFKNLQTEITVNIAHRGSDESDLIDLFMKNFHKNQV